VTRTLSTADERREAILEAAQRVVAARGLHAAPTTEVAKAAGISQAYLFKLFPTKTELLVATVKRGNERIYEAFAEAAAEAKAAGEDPLHAMGETYMKLIEDRDMLLIQLHAHAGAADIPEIREAARQCFALLFDLVERETGADAETIRGFFAVGMLCNVMTALGAADIDEPWAQVLASHPDDKP